MEVMEINNKNIPINTNSSSISKAISLRKSKVTSSSAANINLNINSSVNTVIRPNIDMNIVGINPDLNIKDYTLTQTNNYNTAISNISSQQQQQWQQNK
ncbi:hypothetical protein Glove_141g87 [Diversispora epigaea]|uniref:Uncharacterized protein n=1 Tax=Diversispora epigaea TaxID=1348612 RepID=A0A397J3A5_9GLOM|nr:hypothetical protein Glove_141g87 [Diversispora epigaea]